MPPRAVEFTIQVKRIFQQEDKYQRVSGIGRVRDAPDVQSYLIGTDLYFRASPGETKGPFIRKDLLKLNGIVQPVGWQDQGNQNEFQDYLLRTYVFHESQRSIVISRVEPTHAFPRFCHKSNIFFQETLKMDGGKGGDSRSDVLVAMMLGEKNSLSPEQKNAFRQSGTMHLFAISGLHVGIIALALAWFLDFIPMPGWARMLTGLCILFLYVQITGGQPSAVRAFLMVTFLWASRIIMRHSKPFPALVGSAGFILVLDPSQIRELGFQFSYSVVCAILLYGIPLADQLKAWARSPSIEAVPESGRTLLARVRHTMTQKFLLAFAVSFSATMASTFLTIAHFDIATPGAVFLNLFLLGIAGLAIQGGTLSMICGILHLEQLCVAVNGFSKFLIGLMWWMVEMSLHIPGFHQSVEMRQEWLGSMGVLILMALFLACHHWRNYLQLHFFWIPMAGFATYLSLTVVSVKP